jgi:hypothetical protein
MGAGRDGVWSMSVYDATAEVGGYPSFTAILVLVDIARKRGGPARAVIQGREVIARSDDNPHRLYERHIGSGGKSLMRRG